VGRFRRNHLVPVPEVDSLAELNQLVERWDAEDDARRIGTRPRTVGEHFQVEQPLLNPLPAEPFETGLQLALRVDRYSQITMRTNRYSVPVRLIGRRVRVRLHASEPVENLVMRLGRSGSACGRGGGPGAHGTAAPSSRAIGARWRLTACAGHVKNR